MTSFAEAFVRLHVDDKSLRTDTVKALKSTDVKSAGASTGKSWAKGFGSQAVHVSNVITSAMAGGAVAVGTASVKMAIGFQEAMTTLSTGAGVAEKDLRVIGDGIKKISVQTGTTTDELIKGEFMIASAGFTGASSLKILRAAAEGAKTGNADLATVTDAVTTAMKDYGVKADGATKVTSQLVSIVSHGKTHLTDLATSLSKILPTASSLGLGLDQVGGALATMTGEGVTARLAATHLNSTLLALAAPTGTAAKAMDVLGLSQKNYAKYSKAVADGNKAAAAKILSLGTSASSVADTLKNKGLIAALAMVHKLALQAGPEGSPAFVAAMKAMLGGTAGLATGLQLTGKHMADLVKNTSAVGKASGDAKGRVEGFALVQKDAAFKLAQFSAEGKVAAINIGEKLLPALTATMGFVSGHTGLVLSLAGAVGGLAVAVSVGAKAWALYSDVSKIAKEQALGTRIQLGLLKVQTLAQAAASKIAAAGEWLLNLALWSNPVALVVLAIIALIAIFVVLWVKCKWFRDFWKGLWHDLQAAAVAVWHGVRDAAITVFDAVRLAMAFWVDKLLGFLGMILHGAADAFGWIPGIGPKLKDAAAAFDRFRANVNTALGGINGRTVHVGVAFGGTFQAPGQGKHTMAAGGIVTGGTPGQDSVPILAMPGEVVVPAGMVRSGAVDHLRGRLPGFAAGGMVGVGIRTHLPTLKSMEAAVWPPVEKLASMLAASGVFTTMMGAAIARLAQSFVGKVPYVWGGTSTSGWDCSGLVLNILSRFGFRPPRTAAEQQAWARPTRAPFVGGLAFFGGADGTASSAGHVGIIVGPNMMANAYGTGFGTIDSNFASGGAFGGFGIPPGNRFDKGGWLHEAVAGVGMRSGQGYMFHANEAVTSERGLADMRGEIRALRGDLAVLISAAYGIGGDVAAALGGPARRASFRAEYSPR